MAEVKKLVPKRRFKEFQNAEAWKRFKLLDNVVGVEINFNKVLYKPEVLRPLEIITKELSDLDKELKNLESKLGI